MSTEPGVYGYPTKPIGEHGEYEMKEISFGLPPDALRDIAQFLETVADEIDRGTGSAYWHRHIDECAMDWRERYPDIDIVVVDLSTYG